MHIRARYGHEYMSNQDASSPTTTPDLVEVAA